MGWQVVVEDVVKAQGLGMVACERSAGGMLRVFIDRLDGTTVTIEDCERVTRQLQFVLEVEAVDYARLEVSSPGLDRPLRTPADFDRFIGHEVDVTLKQALGRRKKYRGILSVPQQSVPRPSTPPQAGDGAWALVFRDGEQEQELGFTLDEIREARLVPVVDFKGRRAEPANAPGEPGLAGGQVEATKKSGGRRK